MTFIVDGMLGKLAKWLKILGFDTLFMAADDDKILAVARREGRVLLTRDREFVRRAGRHPSLLIESTSWPDQVRQVLSKFDLFGETRPFTRCLECNTPLDSLSREAAAQLAPLHVLEKSESFSLCPRCGRVFWAGTHQAEMERTVRAILRDSGDAGNV